MKTMRLLSSISVFLLAAFTLYGQVNFAISHSGQSAGLPLGSGSKPGQAGPIGEARIAMANVPLFFETNQGQTDPRVRFFSRGSGYTLFLTPEETVFVEGARRADLGRKSANLRDKAASPRSVLRMKLLGTRSAQRFAGAGELPGKVNYLIGNQSSGWHTGVPLYSQVRAQQVYPGVDLLFHGDAQQLEYDFVVAPEADPNQVAFRIEGAERIELDAQGNLDLHTAANEVTFHKPLVYQFVGAERRAVDGHFVLRGAREIGFAVGAYDRGQPLVIDPTITYSTFLGGAGQEDGDGVGLDTSTPGLPKMYIGGTTSDDTSFPETGSNVYFLGPSKNGSASEYIFVAEIDPTQTGAASLVYLTFIGGSAVPFAGTESPCDNHHGSLALETVNSTVEPVFGGITTCQDYPVTGGSKPTSGTNDIVLTRLEPGGAALDM